MPDRTSKQPVCTTFFPERFFQSRSRFQLLEYPASDCTEKLRVQHRFFLVCYNTVRESYRHLCDSQSMYPALPEKFLIHQRLFDIFDDKIAPVHNIADVLVPAFHFLPAFFHKSEDFCPDLPVCIFDAEFLYLSKKYSLLELLPHELFRSTGNFRKF